MSRVYLDACSIIYVVETESPFHEIAVRKITSFGGDPDAQIVTSRLSRLECRVHPLREADQALLARYDAFFSQRRLAVFEVTAAVIERATHLRARHKFKTPDAIHLATAIDAGATVFLTGDSDLVRCDEVNVEVLQGEPQEETDE